MLAGRSRAREQHTKNASNSQISKCITVEKGTENTEKKNHNEIYRFTYRMMCACVCLFVVCIRPLVHATHTPSCNFPRKRISIFFFVLHPKIHINTTLRDEKRTYTRFIPISKRLIGAAPHSFRSIEYAVRGERTKNKKKMTYHI